jgi:uncharacterized protein
MQVEQFAQIAKQGLTMKVYVQPGASRSELAGIRREELGGRQIERLKICLKARAQAGAANQALIEFLAELLDCPKSSISLTSGQTSRAKSVLIQGAGQIQLDILNQRLLPSPEDGNASASTYRPE